jgi:hypothetical protein
MIDNKIVDDNIELYNKDCKVGKNTMEISTPTVEKRNEK